MMHVAVVSVESQSGADANYVVWMRRRTVKRLNPPCACLYATHNAKGLTETRDDAESECESESVEPLFTIFMVPPTPNGDEEWKNGLYINGGALIDPRYPHSTPRYVAWCRRLDGGTLSRDSLLHLEAYCGEYREHRPDVRAQCPWGNTHQGFRKH